MREKHEIWGLASVMCAHYDPFAPSVLSSGKLFKTICGMKGGKGSGIELLLHY